MLPQTVSAIDSLITSLSGQLSLLQPAYLLSRGRYWQGARTHAVIPLEGSPTPPNPLAKPTDQSENWIAFGIVLPALTEAAFSVEAYVGPQGSGYTIHAHVISGGVRYRRAIHSGPEAWREQNWTAMKVGSVQ